LHPELLGAVKAMLEKGRLIQDEVPADQAIWKNLQKLHPKQKFPEPKIESAKVN
jgi:hypothetical protein